MRAFLPAVMMTAVLGATASCDRPSSPTAVPNEVADAAAEAEPPTREPSIDLERMLTDVAYLSDDQMVGRDSRKVDLIRRAARYIADSHRTAGLRPSARDFLVDFDIEVGSKMGREVHLWLERDGASKAVSGGFVVARTAWNGEPAWGTVAEAPTAVRRPLGATDQITLLRLSTVKDSDVRARIEGLFEAGAKGIIAVVPSGQPLPPLAEADALGKGLAGPLLFMEEAEAVRRFPWGDRPRRGKRVLPLPGVRISMAPIDVPVKEPRPNVLAVIPGSERPDEIVVLGAHYDHIGREEDGVFCMDPTGAADPDDEICNGADDNASGTAMVMEIARAVAESGRQPHRTIVFAHFTGEELGLLGSRALVEALDRTPPFDQGSVVAMLNMDMVGRYREDPGLSIGAVSTSPGWGPLLDQVDPRGLTIVRDPEVNSRSDHASFHRLGIPVLFFFTGLHVDYHRTSDELDHINRDGMNRIAQLVLDVTLELADGPPLPRAPDRTASTSAAPIRDAHRGDLR